MYGGTSDFQIGAKKMQKPESVMVQWCNSSHCMGDLHMC